MLIYRCDRCGSLYPFHSVYMVDESQTYLGVFRMIAAELKGKEGTKAPVQRLKAPLDLCPACTEELDTWCSDGSKCRISTRAEHKEQGADDLCRVHIPKDWQQRLNISPGNELDMWCDGTKIVLAKKEHEINND